MGRKLFTARADSLTVPRHTEIKRERVLDSISKGRAAGKSLGGRPQVITDSEIRNAIRLVESGEPVAEVARDLGMSRATYYRRAKECRRSGPEAHRK